MNWQRSIRPDELPVGTTDIEDHIRLSGSPDPMPHAERIAKAVGREIEDLSEVAPLTQTIRVTGIAP